MNNLRKDLSSLFFASNVYLWYPTMLETTFLLVSDLKWKQIIKRWRSLVQGWQKPSQKYFWKSALISIVTGTFSPTVPDIWWITLNILRTMIKILNYNKNYLSKKWIIKLSFPDFIHGGKVIDHISMKKLYLDA